VENPTKKYVDDSTKRYIDKMLLKKIPLAGIARVTCVSKTWLQEYVNAKYDKVYRKIKVSPKKSGKLSIECDSEAKPLAFEMWSFVGNKGNKQWIWLALDTNTREIVGFYLGSRSCAARPVSGT
jgi:hypothetical protein